MATPYPVSYSIRRPERYNRWTVGFRFILAVPLALLISGWSTVDRHGNPVQQAGPLVLLLGLLVVFAWFTILFTGRFPESMRSTSIGLFRWVANIYAYLLLQGASYPPFGDRPYELSLEITPTETYNRWTVFFRWILAIPHYIVLFFLGIALLIVTIIAWFAILFTGQYPPSLYEFSVGVTRWGVRVAAYIDLFVDQYPPFSLSEETGNEGLQPQTA
jgi:hypothetical protein